MKGKSNECVSTETVRIVDGGDDHTWASVGRRFGVWASLEERNILVLLLVEAGVSVKCMEPKKDEFLPPFTAISYSTILFSLKIITFQIQFSYPIIVFFFKSLT